MAAPGAQQRSASKFIVFENFEKMDTAGSREGLPEKALAWQENLQSIAPNKLVTVPAVAASALATLSATVMWLDFASLSEVDYLIAFTTDGAGYGIKLSDGSVNNFAPPGTFTDADMTVWQAERILIEDPNLGYATWDGSVFVKPGGVSPNFTITAAGSGYSTPPFVSITGGSGTGATASAQIAGGVVIGITLLTPGTGYAADDVLTVTIIGLGGTGALGHVTMTGFDVSSVTIANAGNFSSPAPGTYALSFSGGGGSGAAGTATVIAGGNLGNTVSAVTLTSGGSGYTGVPTVTLSTSGGTSAPAFNAFLGTQQVATIVLDFGGTGYTTLPTVTISGGGADAVQATAHATIAAGAVTSLILDTVGSGYTGTPTVAIGGGSGATATARVWPQIPAGATIAVFQGRVWIGGGGGVTAPLLQWSGTLGYDDFAAANAAGSLDITDADLTHAITTLRAYNNYLFILGDESVKQIGNISINSAGDVTLFTILTLSSDQGTIYRNSCVSFNRVTLFCNKSGIYAVYGSSVQKVSSELDGIFPNIDFSQEPQAAIIDLNGIHNVGFLVRYADPFTSTTRSIILTFDGKRWFVISQGDSLKAIVTTSTLATGTHQIYGSSGSDITQLLSNTGAPVSFRLQTALSHHGNAVQNKKMIRAGFAYQLASGTATITQKVETEQSSRSSTRSIKSGFHVLGYADGVDLSGIFLGQTLTGTLKGLTLTLAAVEYQENALWPQK
jgi:hypothetical protein